MERIGKIHNDPILTKLWKMGTIQKYNSYLKILLVALASIFCLLLINTCSPQNHNTLDKIQNDKRIKVGYIPYYEITSRDPKTGELRGYLVDVWREIAKAYDINPSNIEYIETDWANFGLGLRNKKYDLSIAGTFRTPVRERIVDFSMPLFYLGNGALVRAMDNRFNIISDFNREDITISVVIGEQGYEYAKRHLKKAKLKAIAGSDLSLACLEVEKGLADAALSDQYILKRYADKNPNVKDALANAPYDVLPICWAVSKNDSAFLADLNQKINQLISSGWLERLKDQYKMIPFAAKTDSSKILK